MKLLVLIIVSAALGVLEYEVKTIDGERGKLYTSEPHEVGDTITICLP
jgi:hypothetical protein